MVKIIALPTIKKNSVKITSSYLLERSDP